MAKIELKTTGLDLMFKDSYKLQGNTLYNDKGSETGLMQQNQLILTRY